MADEIKITGPGGQNPQNPAPQGGGQPAAGAQSGGDLNPVIDLRNADQKPAPVQPVPASPASAAPAPAAQAAASDPNAPQQGAPRRKTAILLGEEDEGVQAPPQDKYAIPSIVQEKFPDLIQLIKQTESMNDEERDYWFQILPIMTEEQIKKFRDILVNEKAQLTNLDQEYEQELTKLNEKHMIEWKEFETKEKRKTLTTAESASKETEKSEEEELLKRLSQV